MQFCNFFFFFFVRVATYRLHLSTYRLASPVSKPNIVRQLRQHLLELLLFAISISANNLHTIVTMARLTILLVALVAAMATAFAPVPLTRSGEFDFWYGGSFKLEGFLGGEMTTVSGCGGSFVCSCSTQEVCMTSS